MDQTPSLEGAAWTLVYSAETLKLLVVYRPNSIGDVFSKVISTLSAPPPTPSRPRVAFIYAQSVTVFFVCCAVFRSPDETSQEEGQAAAGREETEDRVQRRPAGPAQEGVHREPVPDRETAPGAGQRAGAERGPDQDMVSEQTGEDQEGERHQEPAGAAADGPGTVQPQHRHGYEGGGRTAGGTGESGDVYCLCCTRARDVVRDRRIATSSAKRPRRRSREMTYAFFSVATPTEKPVRRGQSESKNYNIFYTSIGSVCTTRVRRGCV